MVTTSRVARIFWVLLVAYATVAPWLAVPDAGLISVSTQELLDTMTYRLLCVSSRAENVIDIFDSLTGGLS